MSDTNLNKINVFENSEDEENKFKKYFNRQQKQEVEINKIYPNPFQPRKIFDQVKLEELAVSIKQYGIISPVLLRKINDDKYEILAGERRVKAAEVAMLEKVPAIVGLFSDQEMMEISIIENLQREQLNFIEEAQAFENLSNYVGLTNDEIAQKIGKSRPYVANVMRLLNLPGIVQEYVINGSLTMGQVKPLINLKEEDALKIANQAIEKGLSSRQVENLCNLLKGREDRKKDAAKNPYYEYVNNIINQNLNAKSRIKDGVIKIFFKDEDELKRIVSVLENKKD